MCDCTECVSQNWTCNQSYEQVCSSTEGGIRVDSKKSKRYKCDKNEPFMNTETAEFSDCQYLCKCNATLCAFLFLSFFLFLIIAAAAGGCCWCCWCCLFAWLDIFLCLALVGTYMCWGQFYANLFICYTLLSYHWMAFLALEFVTLVCAHSRFYVLFNHSYATAAILCSCCRCRWLIWPLLL